MKVYITAEYPFIIKKNGDFLGKSIDNSITAYSTETDFFEVYPLISAMPRILIFDKDFCKKTDKKIIKVDLKGGYFVKLLAPDLIEPFSVISQSKIAGALVTTYRENGLKISIETNNDFTVFSPNCEVDLSEFYSNGRAFLVCKCLFRVVIFDVSNSITKVLDHTADEWNFTDVITAKTTIKDMAKHVLTTSFSFDGNAFTPTTSSLSYSPRFSPNNLPLKHLPFAFAEEVIVGGDLTPYLSNNLKENLSAIKSYFGIAKGVFPPPEFKNPFNPLILYKRDENVYFARYLSVDFNGRLITNLKLNDF